jgi:dienelactone hydrolase
MNSGIAALALWPAAALALAGPAAGQTREGALEAGRWPVGFATVVRAASPLEIGIWYPARDSAGTRLTYRGYFLDPGSRDSSLAAELTGLTAFLREHGAPEAEVAAWLGQPMLASSGVEPAGPRFPLVLLAQGNGQTIHDQAPLAEYLASHGYVVATTPSPMRVTGPLAGEEDIGRRAEEQANDLAEARSALASRPDVRPGAIGVVGHSFGARSALLYAMRDRDVAALVSLDGGIGTATGRSSQEQAPSYHPAAMRAPLLHFYERLDQFMAPDFRLLCTLRRSSRWVVEVPHAHHHHFTSLGAAVLLHPALGPALRADAGTAEAYRAVTEATLEFLDAFVRREEAAAVRARAVHPPLGPPRTLSGECG